MQTSWDARKSLVKMFCLKEKENLNFIIQYYFIHLNFAPLSCCSTFYTPWKLKNKAIIFFQNQPRTDRYLDGFCCGLARWKYHITPMPAVLTIERMHSRVQKPCKPCIRLVQGKFDLINQDSSGRKSFTVLKALLEVDVS